MSGSKSWINLFESAIKIKKIFFIKCRFGFLLFYRWKVLFCYAKRILCAVAKQQKIKLNCKKVWLVMYALFINRYVCVHAPRYLESQFFHKFFYTHWTEIDIQFYIFFLLLHLQTGYVTMVKIDRISNYSKFDCVFYVWEFRIEKFTKKQKKFAKTFFLRMNCVNINLMITLQRIPGVIEIIFKRNPIIFNWTKIIDSLEVF